MKRREATRVAAVVLGALVWTAATAAAQTPTVSYQQNGNRVRVEWSAVPGASAYELIVTGAISGQVTVPTTYVEVVPPAGTYTVQVRGVAPGVSGPLSAPVTFAVDGGSAPSCAAPGAPAPANVSIAGNLVSLNWPSVPGTVGYRVQFSRSPGTTEYQQDVPASQTSFAVPIPVLGTFYVRVLSGSPCGALAASREQSFTIGAATPGSPGTPDTPAGVRTPDPAPGQLLPVPAYARDVVLDAARRFAGPLSRACKENHEYLFLLVQELRRYDTRWGLNWKRGDRGQGMSSDVVSYNPTANPDEGNGQVYLFDVVGAECEGNFPSFNNVTAVTWAAQGNPICGAGTYCTRWTIEPYLAAGNRP